MEKIENYNKSSYYLDIRERFRFLSLCAQIATLATNEKASEFS